MKNYLITFSLMGFCWCSCSKEVKKPESLPEEEKITTPLYTKEIPTKDSLTVQQKPDDDFEQSPPSIYKNEDGKEVKVYFINHENGSGSIKIEDHGKVIEAEKKEAWAKGAVYEKGKVSIKSSADLLEVNDHGKITRWKAQ